MTARQSRGGRNRFVARRDRGERQTAKNITSIDQTRGDSSSIACGNHFVARRDRDSDKGDGGRANGCVVIDNVTKTDTDANKCVHVCEALVSPNSTQLIRQRPIGPLP